MKHSKLERSTEPIKLTIPSKSPGYVGHQQTSCKLLPSRNVIRSLEQDLREEKSRNAVKKQQQSHYFTKILEDVDIVRGSTPPFIKKKTQLRESGTYHEISGKQSGGVNKKKPKRRNDASLREWTPKVTMTPGRTRSRFKVLNCLRFHQKRRNNISKQKEQTKKTQNKKNQLPNTIIRNNQFNNMKLLLLLAFFSPLHAFLSSFGQGRVNQNYYLDLIREFTPQSNNDEAKCGQIPALGLPVQAIAKFYAHLQNLFDVRDPNKYVRMFFYDSSNSSNMREYKYGLEVRTFTERTYLAVVIKVPRSGRINEEHETFFVTKDPNHLPIVLKTDKIDLGKFFGCGDLKLLFQRARGA